MINPELIAYISEQLKKGADREVIRKTLKGNGWSDVDINEGMIHIENDNSIPIKPGSIDPNTSIYNTIGKLAIIIIIVLAIAVGGGVFSYFKGWISFGVGTPSDTDNSNTESVIINSDGENINKSIDTEPPSESIILEKADEIVAEALSAAKNRGFDATIKANLVSMLVSAELYYDFNRSFGPVLSEGSCLSESRIMQSMYSVDSGISNLLTNLKEARSENILCAASQGSYAIAASLIVNKDEYFCIDSSTDSRVVFGADKEDVILGSGTANDPYTCNF